MDEKTCRLCGGENGSPITCSVFTKDGLVDLVFKYLSIKIMEEDPFPKCICDTCLFKIERFHEFAIQCQQYQEILLTDDKKFPIEFGHLAVDIEPKVKCEDESDDGEFNNSIHEFDCKDELSFGEEDSLPLSECANRASLRSKIKSKRLVQNTLKKTTRHNSKTIEGNHINNEDSTEGKKPAGDKCRKRKARNDSHNGKKGNSTKKKRKMDATNIDNAVKTSVDGLDKTVIELKSDDVTTLEAADYSYIKYDCHLCIEKFENWSNLAGHVEWSHTVRPRVICICKTPLYSITAIYTHIKKHGHNPTINTCKDCNRVFLKKDNYERHLSRHLPGEKNSGYQRECPKCPKVLSSAKRYNQHMLKHEKMNDKSKTKCDACNRFFSTPQSLKYHKSAVHEKNKPFICDICGHAFNQRNNLESHRRVHADRPVLQCDYCPRKFINKRYLRHHILCHSGLSYKCPVCNVTFNYKSTLNNHMMTHQNIYKYVCGFCNKGFKWQTSLKTHLNIHTGATPYSCPWCPRSFSDRSNCRLHKRKNHPKELAEFEKKNGIVHLGKTVQFDKNIPALIIPLKNPNEIKVKVFPVVDQIREIVE